MKFTRRRFAKLTAAAGGALMLPWRFRIARAQIPGGSLEPDLIPKYRLPLVKLPAFIPIRRLAGRRRVRTDYYEIAVRQFRQQILPSAYPMTTVWGYGPSNERRTRSLMEGGRFSYPALSFETEAQKPIAVKWINELVDADGNHLPHMFRVDQTLHWANPPGPRDTAGTSQEPYTGPIPLVTHLHGAHSGEESDGYPEAWYLPALAPGKLRAADIAYTRGTFVDYYMQNSGLQFEPGASTFHYENEQRATTLWYHDHALGITRINIYTGLVGLYLIRGGPDDVVLDSRDGTSAVLPGPAPGTGINPFGTFHEIPMIIQDRSFNDDGSLFYPDNRAFFEGMDPDQLRIPFTPEAACTGDSDVPAYWNPEFFGNTIVVNGRTWPYLDVEQRRYRFRILNACNSRFLILKFDHPGVRVWQIGADGGFLPQPVDVDAMSGGRMLMAKAERIDIIVDFSEVAVGTPVTMLNLAPDEPFGGGEQGVDFEPSDPDTTGQVMELRVGPSRGVDRTTPPQYLQLPAITHPTGGDAHPLSLNEEESATVKVVESDGNIVMACDDPQAAPFGPTAALLGTLNPDGTGNAIRWGAPVTENPGVGETQVWELYNFTEDAHPIHVHLIQFQVVGREAIGGGPSVTGSNGPQPGETGFKDTVISYPGEITRIRAKFDRAGFFVWHCHILEHEDNEMMRPYHVGPIPAGAPGQDMA